MKKRDLFGSCRRDSLVLEVKVERISGRYFWGVEGRTRETFFFRGVFSLREGGFRGDFSRVTFLRGEIFFGEHFLREIVEGGIFWRRYF